MDATGEHEPMDCGLSVAEIDPKQGAEEAKKEGNEFYKNGEYDRAIEFYTQAINLQPQCAVYYGNRSAALMMVGKYAQALDDCTRSVQRDEKYTKGYFRAAKCHLMLGNPPLAIDYYHKVLKVEAKNKQAREELEVAKRVQHNLSMADVQTKKQEHRAAVFYLDRCLDDTPSCLWFMTMKAEALMFAKRYNDAQSLANDLLRQDRNNVDAIYVKAMCFYYEDISDKATQFFQQALRIAPDHTKSRQAIKKSKLLLSKKEEGNTALKQGRIQQAWDTYSEALNIDSHNTFTNAKLYCNRALAASKLGRLEEAITDCTLAIELDSEYIRAYQRRARLYQDTDQHEEAVRDYEKVLQLDRSHENQATLKEAKRLEKISKRKDYYKILSIERSASQEQIKQAYRKGAMKHHPDRHVSAEPEEREKEEKIFKDVSEAYSVLSDPKKKNRYDSGHDLDDLEMPDFDPTDLFSSLFGGGFHHGGFPGGGRSHSHGGGGTYFSFGGPSGMHFQF